MRSARKHRALTAPVLASRLLRQHCALVQPVDQVLHKALQIEVVEARVELLEPLFRVDDLRVGHVGRSITKTRAFPRRTTQSSRHQHLSELQVELAPLHQLVRENELVGVVQFQLCHSNHLAQVRAHPRRPRPERRRQPRRPWPRRHVLAKSFFRRFFGGLFFILFLLLFIFFEKKWTK